MHISIRLLMFLFILFTNSSLFADPIVHEETGVAFPDELMGFTRTGYHKYDVPQLGASYEYKTPKGDLATIYIYNAGISNVPDDITHPIITQHREQVLQEISQVAEARGKSVQHMIDNVTLKVSGNNSDIQVLFDSFIIRAPATNTELWLWPARGYFVKIRMTRGLNSDLSFKKRRAFCEAIVRIAE